MDPTYPQMPLAPQRNKGLRTPNWATTVVNNSFNKAFISCEKRGIGELVKPDDGF